MQQTLTTISPVIAPTGTLLLGVGGRRVSRTQRTVTVSVASSEPISLRGHIALGGRVIGMIGPRDFPAGRHGITLELTNLVGHGQAVLKLTARDAAGREKPLSGRVTIPG